MKRFLALLLATLALCCYEANAGVVCPPVAFESFIFLGGTKAQLAAELAKYGAPPEAVAAKMEVKKCVDKIDIVKEELIKKTLIAEKTGKIQDPQVQQEKMAD
uniref:secretoglobin family 1D member 1-like n=1 Tax=Jaculus jaculus TaxID=51337 RepID=UPI001E1B520F|nr:secretoglobin family 1D member 1-like [Jaculus jaculus]